MMEMHSITHIIHLGWKPSFESITLIKSHSDIRLFHIQFYFGSVSLNSRVYSIDTFALWIRLLYIVQI